MDKEKLKRVLTRGLTVLRVVTRLTPNKLDDQAVWLFQLLIDESEILDLLIDAMAAKGFTVEDLVQETDYV